MKNADHRLRNGRNFAGQCRTRINMVATISWADVSTNLLHRIRTMDPALQQHSHDVDASNHRRVLHRERWNRQRTTRTSETMVSRDPQATMRKCAGDSIRKNKNRSGATNRNFIKNVSPPWDRSQCSGSRRGQALLEFAILIPIIIILIGATISFGLFFFQANVLQQAVDVTAQEIARMPFEPCLLYTSPSPRDKRQSRMPSSA